MLKPADLQVLLIFARCYEAGYAPTVRELAPELKVSSPATVHARLLGLGRQGLLERRKRGSGGCVYVLTAADKRELAALDGEAMAVQGWATLGAFQLWQALQERMLRSGLGYQRLAELSGLPLDSVVRAGEDGIDHLRAQQLLALAAAAGARLEHLDAA